MDFMNLVLLAQQDGSGAAAGAAIGNLIGLILGIIAIVGMWRVFTKAGKPGWAAIIPIYNIWVLLEITGRPGWWIILFFIPFVNLIAAILVMLKLSEAFGKGVGFAIGLILLSPIFVIILGFGDAKYKGAPA